MTSISNDELKKLPRNCFPFNSSGAVVIHKSILSSICKELLELRNKLEKEA
jgi:hypothetical protein